MSEFARVNDLSPIFIHSGVRIFHGIVLLNLFVACQQIVFKGFVANVGGWLLCINPYILVQGAIFSIPCIKTRVLILHVCIVYHSSSIVYVSLKKF